MIGVPAAVLIGLLLLLVLLLLAVQGMSRTRDLRFGSDLPPADDAPPALVCPPEFVSRVFSTNDLEFVSTTNSPQLRRMFRRERKLVALLWIQETGSAIREIMREHTRITRASEDIDFGTEFRLVLLYLELRLICGVLLIGIQSAGPFALRSLAVYADTHVRRLADIRQSLRVSSPDRQLGGVESH
jgi:hypothetical protein